MIKLFEVSVELDSGSILNVLMAAGSADDAKLAVHTSLQHVSEPRGGGDAIRYCWRYDEMTVAEVSISTAA